MVSQKGTGEAANQPNFTGGIYFLQGILADARMTDLDRDVQEEMVKELVQRLDAYITGVIVDHMPERHLNTFMTMNEQQRPRAELERFVHEHVPNASAVFTTAFADFRELYLRKGG